MRKLTWKGRQYGERANNFIGGCRPRSGRELTGNAQSCIGPRKETQSRKHGEQWKMVAHRVNYYGVLIGFPRALSRVSFRWNLNAIGIVWRPNPSPYLPSA